MGFAADQNLRLDVDPKQAWADLHLREAPVELNQADRQTLLRVPGIGPKSAARILQARQQGRLTDLKDLQALGVPSPQKAAPYVLLNSSYPLQQLALFPLHPSEE